jgi:hypothetical protein
MGGSDSFDDQRGGMPYGGIQVGKEYTDRAWGLMSDAWSRYGSPEAPTGTFDFSSEFAAPRGEIGNYWTQAQEMSEAASPMSTWRTQGALLGDEAGGNLANMFANRRGATGLLYSGSGQQQMYEAALAPRLQYELAGQQAQQAMRQGIFERATGIGTTSAQLGLGELQRLSGQYGQGLGYVGQMFGAAARFGEPTYYFPPEEQGGGVT